MRIRLSEQQTALREAIGELLDPDLVPVIRRMGERESGAGPDCPPTAEERQARDAVWRALAGMGTLGTALPPAAGGLGQCQAELVVVAEAMGEAGYRSPLLDTLTAAEFLLACGGDHDAYLAEIVAGAPVAIAARDRRQADPATPGTVNLDRAAGRSSAERHFVAFAPDVDRLLFVGGDESGTYPLLVRPGDPAVTWRRHDDIGRGDLYRVHFDGVPVEASAWLAPPDRAAAAWHHVMVNARIRQAAYLVGLARGALDLAVRYARERRQFGQPIGRFQSLAFRMAAAAASADAASLLVHHAAWQADRGDDAELSALEALSTAADLARQVTTDVVQIHGAVGSRALPLLRQEVAA
jgi:butyryl-CoA dehydrogenase